MSNQLRKAIFQYLTSEFRPVRILTNIENVNKINYSNAIFTVKSVCNGIEFEFNERQKEPRHLKSPAVTFAQKLLPERKFKVKNHLEATKNIYGSDSYIAFDTYGAIPLRWIKMIMDFSGIEFVIDTQSKGQLLVEPSHFTYFRNVIMSIESNLLEDIVRTAVKKQDYTVSVLDTDWETPDASCRKFSEFTKKVINNTKKYNSLYSEIYFQEKPRYFPLHSSCGGLSCSYYWEFPYDVLLDAYSIRHMRYRDMYGYRTYRNDLKELPFEEVVIFGEILKHNKCNVKEEYLL